MSDVYKEKLELIENMYTDLDKRYSLISNLISPKVVSTERYKAFKKIVYEDFVPFINKVNAVSNEAELVMKLKGIEDQLRLVESLKRFNNKTIVAVSGGFSSGKSSFISSLFSQQDIQLPIGIEPMTSIPTYIVHADDLEQDKQSPVTGYTKTGGEVEIPLELYSQLSHEYVKDFRFNLKELLPFMVLETDIQAHPHLCFIDLPGYNPGERIGFTGQDELSASEFMTQAQCILWVISIDAGTISRDDIDFMREHIPEGAKLYVVLNKADLRPPSDIEDIINGIAGLLEVDGVEFDGISAYSSEFQQEFSFYKQSLHDVLSSWDEKRDTYKNILVELSEVFAIYKEAIVRQIEEKSEVSSKLVSLELDLHELGSFEEGDDSPQQYSKRALERRQEKIETVKETLWSFKNALHVDELEQQLVELESIFNSVLEALVDDEGARMKYALPEISISGESLEVSSIDESNTIIDDLQVQLDTIHETIEQVEEEKEELILSDSLVEIETDTLFENKRVIITCELLNIKDVELTFKNCDIEIEGDKTRFTFDTVDSKVSFIGSTLMQKKKTKKPLFYSRDSDKGTVYFEESEVHFYSRFCKVVIFKSVNTIFVQSEVYDQRKTVFESKGLILNNSEFKIFHNNCSYFEMDLGEVTGSNFVQLNPDKLDDIDLVLLRVLSSGKYLFSQSFLSIRPLVFKNCSFEKFLHVCKSPQSVEGCVFVNCSDCINYAGVTYSGGYLPVINGCTFKGCTVATSGSVNLTDSTFDSCYGRVINDPHKSIIKDSKFTNITVSDEYSLMNFDYNERYDGDSVVQNCIFEHIVFNEYSEPLANCSADGTYPSYWYVDFSENKFVALKNPHNRTVVDETYLKSGWLKDTYETGIRTSENIGLDD